MAVGRRLPFGPMRSRAGRVRRGSDPMAARHRRVTGIVGAAAISLRHRATRPGVSVSRQSAMRRHFHRHGLQTRCGVSIGWGVCRRARSPPRCRTRPREAPRWSRPPRGDKMAPCTGPDAARGRAHPCHWRLIAPCLETEAPSRETGVPKPCRPVALWVETSRTLSGEASHLVRVRSHHGWDASHLVGVRSHHERRRPRRPQITRG